MCRVVWYEEAERIESFANGDGTKSTRCREKCYRLTVKQR